MPFYDRESSKVVESLCSSNPSNRERLYREFGVYLTFDKAYQSACLDVLFLELCVSVLSD